MRQRCDAFEDSDVVRVVAISHFEKLGAVRPAVRGDRFDFSGDVAGKSAYE